MAKKNNNKEHITNILNLNKDSENYGNDIDTYSKRYKAMLKKLYMYEGISNEADEVFKWLHNKDTNLKSLTAKTREKVYFEKDISEVFLKQNEYYKGYLYNSILENTMNQCYSISDAHIVLDENAYKYSIPISKEVINNDIFLQDDFLVSLGRKIKELNSFIDKTLRLVFIEYLEAPNEKLLNINDFETIIHESVKNYMVVKNNKSSINEPQYNNPFLNLYLYMRNSYVKNFYDISLPNKHYFDKCKNYNINIDFKKFYSLEDVAKYLGLIMDIESGKMYNRLKDNFRNNLKIREYKKGRPYKFPNIITPISHYLFYIKNNELLVKNNNNLGCNTIIEYRVEPILRALINNDNKRLDTIFKYFDFINTEFNEIMNTFNHCYQETMLEFWHDTIVNIYFRTLGLSSDIVYQNY